MGGAGRKGSEDEQGQTPEDGEGLAGMNSAQV